MEKKSVALSVWKRYQTYNLRISPSLASAFHLFEYQGLSIKITLPKRPKQQNWTNDNSPITCHGYRQGKNRNIPLYFQVHQVDATIETGIRRNIRKDAIGVVNYNLFNKREHASLGKILDSNEAILDSAFDHWINVMRWCTEQPTICQLSHIRQDTHWGTYLVDSTTDKRFYCSISTFKIQGSPRIKKIEWNKAQRILSEGKDVPIWQLYYAEAYERLEIGDIRGYIISLAISSETIIRHLTRYFLKEPVNIKYQSIVDTVPISGIIDSWHKLGFNSPSWKSLNKERKVIKNIFELRNGIMHRGENPSIAKHRQVELGEAVKRFLKQGEKHIHSKIKK